MEQIQQLQQWVDESGYIVFFGGAGVSTESGIPDFRSTDGLYHQQVPLPARRRSSATAFICSSPEEFYRFYRDKMLCLTPSPTTAHYKLAELEQAGKLQAQW